MLPGVTRIIHDLYHTCDARLLGWDLHGVRNADPAQPLKTTGDELDDLSDL